jgi:type IV pilus assembly protein PilW
MMNNYPVKRLAKASGATLVELMVSIIISLMITAGVITSFISVKMNYKMATNASDMQETGRYALHGMAQDIRLAGFWGINVRPSTISQGSTSSMALGCSPNGWVTSVGSPLVVLNNPSAVDLPGCISDENHLDGTDIIIVRHVGSALDSAADIEKDNVYMHAGIFQANIFVANSAGALNISADFTAIPVALIYPFEAHIYYVRPCSLLGDNDVCDNTDDDGKPIPTLVRQTLSGNSMSSEPVSQYVENLQVLLGEDTDNDNIIDRLKTPNNVLDWGNVHSLEVSLLVRSPGIEGSHTENINGPKDPANSDKRGSYTFGGQTIEKTDKYRRKILSSTVFIRNDPISNVY